MNAEAFKSLGAMISAVGTPSFWRALAELCSCVAESSGPMIYTFSRKQHPRVLFPESRLEERDLYINSYLRAAYSTDPYYTAFLEKTPARLYTLREIAPADFYQTEYFGEYYRHTNVADEVAYLVSVADDTAIHISLTRLWSEPTFSEAEVESLRTLEPVVMAAVERHLEQCPLQGAEFDDEGEGSQLETAFEAFGRDELSPREREVAQLLLRGHSPRSVADQLDLSIDTVRNHRRNIYRKLDISSHSELFGRFLDLIDSIAVG